MTRAWEYKCLLPTHYSEGCGVLSSRGEKRKSAGGCPALSGYLDWVGWGELAPVAPAAAVPAATAAPTTAATTAAPA